MQPGLAEIALRWRLDSTDCRAMVAAYFDQSCDPLFVHDCLDIDRALLWLLGNRPITRDWLRRPHPAFYHAPPLYIALGPQAGRRRLRQSLLAEAAQASDAHALCGLRAAESA